MKVFNINTIKGFLFWVLVLPFIMSLIIKSIDYNLEKNEFELQFEKLKHTYDYSYTFEKPKYDNQIIKELISDEEYQYECNKKNGIYTNFNHSSLLYIFLMDQTLDSCIYNDDDSPSGIGSNFLNTDSPS